MRRTAPILAALCLLPGADGFRSSPRTTRTAPGRARPPRIRAAPAGDDGSSDSDGASGGPSAASEWMENERRMEEEMDREGAGEEAGEAAVGGAGPSAAADDGAPREGSGRW